MNSTAEQSPPPLDFPSITTTVDDGFSSISAVHPDILKSHVLTRLDGTTLASVSCTSSELNFLVSQEQLWTNICISTWPSINTPRILQLISSFPNGSRSFFSSSFPLISVAQNGTVSSLKSNRPSELISAADIHYKNELIFSKVIETETESGWFNCSPFRIDMLDPKDTCQTNIQYPETEEDRRRFAEELSLSWILIDSAGKRAMNVSSYKPVLVQKHWLSGEVHVRFSAILGGEKGSSSECVQCGILVTCGGGREKEGMHVREVSLQVEDMDGMFLNGKDSLGILDRSFEGKKGIKGRKIEEGKKMYEGFLEMKRGRKERKLKIESTLDVLCVAFGVLIFGSFVLCVLLR